MTQVYTKTNQQLTWLNQAINDITAGPGEEDYFTQWYGGDAIFRITPFDEATARAFAIGHQPQPVRPYELAALPLPRMEPTQDQNMDDDEY